LGKDEETAAGGIGNADGGIKKDEVRGRLGKKWDLGDVVD
jgi:hypothetical protein